MTHREQPKIDFIKMTGELKNSNSQNESPTKEAYRHVEAKNRHLHFK